MQMFTCPKCSALVTKGENAPIGCPCCGYGPDVLAAPFPADTITTPAVKPYEPYPWGKTSDGAVDEPWFVPTYPEDRAWWGVGDYYPYVTCTTDNSVAFN